MVRNLQTSKIYKRNSVLHFVTLAFIFIFISATNPATAQEIPCFDLRDDRGEIELLSRQRKTLSDPCRNRTNNIQQTKQESIGAITISGHITHQNGVRMSGVTMSLRDWDTDTTQTTETDENGNYFFGNLTFGYTYELTPSLEGYLFYPPRVTWHGIVEPEVWNFIADGPPPEEPPVPPGTPNLGWTSYYNNEANSTDYRPMIGRDETGNTYLGGTSFVLGSSGNTDIVVSKIDPNGNLIWSRQFDGTANYKDILQDMAVAPNGDIYLTGYSYSLASDGSNWRSYDYVTLKYDTNGNQLWMRTYEHRVAYNDYARSLKIDASGNAYVTGMSWDENIYSDYATLKYDTDGNLVWAKRYSSIYGESGYEVEVDDTGNVYVTGISQNGTGGSSEDILTIKYDADGNELWQNRYNSDTNESDEGMEIELDNAGNLYVLGESYIDFFPQVVIQKINAADGTTVWTKNYVVADGFEGTTPTAMKLDANGNIILTGMCNMSGEFYNVDAFTTKFDADGVMLWEKIYDGLNDEDFDGDTKFVIGADGSVYTGLTSEGFANPDIQVIKYSSDGEEMWRYRFGNPFFDYDGMMDWGADLAQNAMLLDESGNVYLAGESFIPGQGPNMVALKLEPLSDLRASAFDFDGDGKAEIAVYRPETGVWHVLNSSDGSYKSFQWGLENDKLVPADYDGDGKYDPAVFRDGIWYIQNSSDGVNSYKQFGLSTDIPVPSDFDNDGKADLGVFREGVWHQLNSADNSYKALQFGISTDKPIPSDYDKNRRSDVAVFRDGRWYISYQAELPYNSFQLGISSDKPVPADYDGDGQTDYAVFREGVWYVWQSRTSSFKIFQWGISTDVPVPADYDGDKKADFAVYRNGVWYIWNSDSDTNTIIQFGIKTDKPIPSAYLN